VNSTFTGVDDSLVPPQPQQPPPPPPSYNPFQARTNDYHVPTLHYRPPSQASTSSSSSTRSPKHGRSASHPFPILFGKKASDNRSDRVERFGSSGHAHVAMAESRGGFLSTSLPRSSSGKGSATTPVNENDLVSGKCATCDSTVRWPRHLDVFRCTVCFMITDLQYPMSKEAATPYSESSGKAGTFRISRKSTKRDWNVQGSH